MMRTTERDAQLKLLTLQGALYRGEIINAKIAVFDASESFGKARRLLRLLAFALEYRKTTVIGAVVSGLLGRGRGSRFARRALVIVRSSLLVWWLMRRRTELQARRR